MVLPKHELEGKLGEETALIESSALRDENPLEESDEFNQLILTCRKGDLRRCQELISQGVNINAKDRFDCTPLIIVSALAERNTFQGERCIYNALNDRIRNLLLQYDFSKTSDPYVYWSGHLASLLTRTVPWTSDISLSSGSQAFHLHKFMLAARTPYFRRKLEAQPGTTSWSLAGAVPAESVRLVLGHIYLADLPRDLAPPGGSVSEEQVARGLDKISRQLGLDHLWEAIMAGHDRRLARQRFRDEEERALAQLGDFFRSSVLGRKVVVDADRVGDVGWKHDNPAFADVLLRADEADEDEPEPEPDATTATGRPPRSAALYPVHKAVLIRSEYFAKMFSGDFVESQRAEHLRIVTVDFSPAVLELVLTFLYTETIACPLQHALDLLYAADMLLLDALKAKAAQAISTLGSGTSDTPLAHGVPGKGGPAPPTEPINIYDVIHAAWDLGVQRLEEFAARYLANRLEDYVDDPDFQDLIRESAERIHRREETDTIELLDDIRYHLSERFRLRFEDAGLDEMMRGGDRGDGDGAEAAAKSSAGTACAVPALDGGEAQDEFASDALSYQMLLGKIDAMLERLKLDA
ncbi:hypothetical protein UVI_02054250 [Ustilaginoidea virens]|uniref:BTB domain-containing protein n=1 Tax=Ustilaginoidea virens TaxID=1159556 RepID=A0A1B5KYE4_USTVR|nr:hypothetical protein UVI_02054250 [Ustilaginoidea virens]